MWSESGMDRLSQGLPLANCNDPSARAHERPRAQPKSSASPSWLQNPQLLDELA